MIIRSSITWCKPMPISMTLGNGDTGLPLSHQFILIYIDLMFNDSNILSHTWVRYPGFSGHGVKCPILTTVVPGFSSDLIGCTIRSKWGPFVDLYLARKNLLFVWNKLFLVDIKFSQRRIRPVKSLWWQIVPMQESTNEWKNLTFFQNMGLAETQW